MLPAKPLRKRKRQRVAPLLSIGKRPIGKAKANSAFIGFGGVFEQSPAPSDVALVPSEVVRRRVARLRRICEQTDAAVSIFGIAATAAQSHAEAGIHRKKPRICGMQKISLFLRVAKAENLLVQCAADALYRTHRALFAVLLRRAYGIAVVRGLAAHGCRPKQCHSLKLIAISAFGKQGTVSGSEKKLYFLVRVTKASLPKRKMLAFCR